MTNFQPLDILCDVDGPVADLNTYWLMLYNADYNDNLTADQWTAWDIVPSLKRECGVKIYDYLKRPDLYDGVLPVPGALETIQQLRADGHKVIFITSTMVAGDKYIWLVRHGFLSDSAADRQFYMEVHSDEKWRVTGDVLIDDRFKTIKAFPGKGLLYTAPHNAHERWRDRVDDWSAVLHAIRNIVQVRQLQAAFEVAQPERLEALAADHAAANTLADVPHAAVKVDGGKPRFDLAPAEAMIELAKLWGWGASKYADRNWEKGFDWGRPFAAMMRHAWAFWGGEERDEESGAHHLIAAAWNALVLYINTRHYPERDTRSALKLTETPALVPLPARENGK